MFFDETHCRKVAIIVNYFKNAVAFLQNKPMYIFIFYLFSAFIQTDSELRYLVDGGASGNHFAEVNIVWYTVSIFNTVYMLKLPLVGLNYKAAQIKYFETNQFQDLKLIVFFFLFQALPEDNG